MLAGLQPITQRHGVQRTVALVVTILAIVGGSARADDDEDAAAARIAAMRADGLMFHDGKGHYLAIRIHPETTGRLATPRVDVYYGRRDSLHRLPSSPTAGTEAKRDPDGAIETAQWSYEDPRAPRSPNLDYLAAGAEVTTRCMTKGPTVSFRAVDRASARKLLAKAKLDDTPMWRRYPYLLARDNGTTYYYVDRARLPANNTDFRVFAGKRGAMRQVKLRDLASDGAGHALLGTTGALRVVFEGRDREIASVTWTPRGKKQAQPLIVVPLDNDLVYGGLGIYDGQRFGTPCDDI